MKRLSRAWRALLEFVHATPVVGLPAVFLAGAVLWGGFNWSLELTNTEAFCISCHVMRDNVYKEYRTTVHFQNRTGVRASCPDCHVPREWFHKVVRKVSATNELFHWLRGSIDTRVKFEAKRGELARHVWASMEATDSRECRNCHDFGFMTEETQSPRAGVMHSIANEWGKTCIDCHKGIAHTLPRDFDDTAFVDQLHDRMEQTNIGCRQCHEGIAAPPRGEEW